MVNVSLDATESCNRTITVYGKGNQVPPGGTAEHPLDLFVGNAGTAARFLSAFVCLGSGFYRLHGVPRMHERPQAALFEALRSLGYHVRSSNNKLPALIQGGGARPGKCQVAIGESSQFASALLLASRTGRWDVHVLQEQTEEAAYVAMTSRMLEVFPRAGGNFQIEPDASSGSYFLALNRLGDSVQVAHWPTSGWQIDEQFSRAIGMIGADPATPDCDEQTRTWVATHLPGGAISRTRTLGDSIMTAIVIAPIVAGSNADQPIRFTDLGRLRLQECERVAALRTELTRCGARVIEKGDALEVFASQLHGAEIETYDDHRMAMCFAILALKVPGIKIKNPACVKKTFPNFFQRLASPAPQGVGATVLDAHSGKPLSSSDLFAA